MNILKISLTILLNTFLLATGLCQNQKTIEHMAKAHQDCLDTGHDMLGCSKHYYFQMDSMLTLVYKKLYSKLDKNGKTALQKDQANWVKKRDLYFEKQEKAFADKLKTGEWGADMEMIPYGNDGEFIKNRVLILIRRLPKQ